MQIVFLMIWPVFAICFTPLIGLLTALMLKQASAIPPSSPNEPIEP